MTFLVTLDLYSILLVCLIPPILVFLCGFAYYVSRSMYGIYQNRYVTRLMKDYNKVQREYLDLQHEFMDEIANREKND